ncbi:sorbitol/mannitol transport system substrate-binding protein [Granulicella aggregans]|uniref:Sorbitol/mannitol transport system substrate-binding protein n=1 Tax=Granulicella aggregans TaxID=474949 RepID=A0A7W8E561_9BACT|nr:sugar ABC transporter substrate-binding protein [Granulicella aggregans]MBB5059342.1 sorbitol/mannitol transport system substrate-binding protein [Granulicella aggregans]
MLPLFGSLLLTVFSACAQTTLTIATVNNGDMIVMQRLAKQFEQQHPEIRLDWVILEEKILREKTTTDAAAHGGQFDIVTIGPLEAPIWGRRGWLLPLEDKLSSSYDLNDLLRPMRDGASDSGHLYALPFYGESSMTYYRKDLFRRAGLTMPLQPTYDDISRFAQKLNDPAHDLSGICLRGKPGWGENMGYISTVANTFGGRWFDESWRPQFDSPEWHAAVSYYVDLLQKYGPPGSSSNGFNESLTLFENGRCAMWIDATVAAGSLSNAKQSKVASTVGYASAPIATTPRGSQWLWFWALGIPSSSKHPEAALKFIEWATSKEYIQLVAQTNGWETVPPGTRESTYKQLQYLDAAPFAGLTYRSIMAADPLHPTEKPVPYTGVQCIVIPSFPTIGNQVGQLIAAALVGNMSVDEALHKAQLATERVERRAGLLHQ